MRSSRRADRPTTRSRPRPTTAIGEAGTLTFPSALDDAASPRTTSSTRRLFPAQDKRRAVVVHAAVELRCRRAHRAVATARAGWGSRALRLSLPYHDRRMPPELTRADYIVSSNVVRTVQVCRQAVLDARRALWWLRDQGYERLGLLGTSLGSCLAMLTAVARAAGARAGTQSRLAVFCRRRLAWPVDVARARRARRPYRARDAARAVAADQPLVVSRTRARRRRRCSFTRSTT